MSIEGLINRFGITLYVYRPTTTVGTDGQVNRSYSRVNEIRGFVQPAGQTSEVYQGRMEGRTPCTIYISGSVDIRIDDELRDGFYGIVRNWRVSGASVPGETVAANSAWQLAMTVVDAVEIEPEVVL
ncbi:MAG: hypothetical protein EB060_10530 [Proteobacteria bacterium]|nr:hypothetical protein [Pseudomonadota bacterium]